MPSEADNKLMIFMGQLKNGPQNGYLKMLRNCSLFIFFSLFR